MFGTLCPPPVLPLMPDLAIHEVHVAEDDLGDFPGKLIDMKNGVTR